MNLGGGTQIFSPYNALTPETVSVPCGKWGTMVADGIKFANQMTLK